MNVAQLSSEARTHRPAGHPPAPSGRVGVLIVNLGTPEGTDYWSIRRYLQEFLSDRRVIETPRVLWAPILQAILLRRPHAKGRDYDAIWNKQRNEGPLKTITRSQGEKLGVALHDLDKEVVVDWAMRYGAPPIAERLKALQAEGCDRILVIPLYPQYCAASTATVGDKAFEALQAMRWQPAIRVAAPYYDDPVYIDALARSVRAAPRRARFRAGGPGRLLSRHSAGLFRQGRPLFLPLREDDAALARRARHERGGAAHDLSVAVWARRMAASPIPPRPCANSRAPASSGSRS